MRALEAWLHSRHCEERQRRSNLWARNRSAATAARQAIVGIVVALFTATAVSAGELLDYTFERSGKRFSFYSEVVINAPLPEVFDVLTDYNEFYRVSNVMTESGYLDPQEDGTPVVYSTAQGCLWKMFCKTIRRVEVLESEPQSLVVTTALPDRSDVPYSRSSWRLTADGDSTRVIYELELEPGFWVPPLIGTAVVKNKIRKHGIAATNGIERLARVRAAGAGDTFAE